MLRNLHQLFVLCTASQISGGDFAKFCGLLRIYELYKICTTISSSEKDLPAQLSDICSPTVCCFVGKLTSFFLGVLPAGA